MVAHTVRELREGVLDVGRMLFVLKVFGDLSVGEPAAEPGVPPEEERHQDDQPGGDEDEGTIAGRHFVVRGGGRLLRRGIEGKFGVGGSFWGRWWRGHVLLALAVGKRAASGRPAISFARNGAGAR